MCFLWQCRVPVPIFKHPKLAAKQVTRGMEGAAKRYSIKPKYVQEICVRLGQLPAGLFGQTLK